VNVKEPNTGTDCAYATVGSNAKPSNARKKRKRFMLTDYPLTLLN